MDELASAARLTPWLARMDLAALLWSPILTGRWPLERTKLSTKFLPLGMEMVS